MANHKSAIKRAQQSEVKRVRNKGYKTRVKKAIKEVRVAISSNNTDEAKEKFIVATSIIQKTSGHGIIHKNQAARKISRLSKQINQISAS